MKTFFVLAIAFTSLSAYAQDVKQVQLKQQHAAFAPKGYYISNVIDDRASDALGTISEDGSIKKLVLAGGTAAAIKSFIEHNVTQNKAMQPIVLHVDKIEINARKTGGSVQTEAMTTFAFYIGDNRVAEYTGKGRAQTSGDASDYIEGFIRKSIENDLKDIETWWGQHKGEIPTTSSVKVNVTISRTTDKPDCIVYSQQRPLSIQDFTGPPEGQIQELAATYSGIGVGYKSQTENGQVVVDMTITPYFVRGQSWFKEEGKNARVLAHEQAHFDVTAIKACELAAIMRSTAFTQENYQALIDKLQKQNARDANEEESLYDSETNHGIIFDKQIEWQNKLKEKVREVGCY